MLGTAFSGVRVLDFSQIGAGPLCGMLMGDMGADVIKLEALSGDLGRRLGPPWLSGESVIAMSFNRNKRGLAIDLKKPEALVAVRGMAARADVLIESFRPGVMERLGLGYAALAALRPTLVYCSVSAYGQASPWRDRAGVDGIVQAISGLMSNIGIEGAPPCKVQVPAVDMATGFLAALAVSAALRTAERGGHGEHLDVSMYNASMLLQLPALATYFASGEKPARIGSAAPYAAPNEAVPTKDGWIMLAAYQEDRWKALCELIGQPGLAADPAFANIAARVKNRARLVEILSAALRSRTTREWLPLLEERDILCAPIADYDEVTSTDQFAASGVAVEFDHPLAGRVRLPGFAIGDPDAQSRQYRPPPVLGQHSVEVLGEYGVPRDAIDRLVADGAVMQRQLA
ncbi:MAG: CoA transferase [Betaproteobacteria bacterium]|nr:CoA transferase [Betaproteobacteria bacterium]